MDAFLTLKNKRLIIGGVILVLLALGCLAFVQIQSSGKNQTQSTQAIKTAVVTMGDLTTEISGTGSIVAPNAIDLSFSTTGKVGELNVNPGKSVVVGDVLAKLDRISELKLNVENAKLNLSAAQKTLDDLEANKDVTLANALTAQSDSAKALEKAQKGEVNKYSGRCEKAVTEQYYYDYMYARADYLYWAKFLEGGSGYGEMYIRENMAPNELKMRNAYSNWKYCEGYSELEIEQSKASVDKAQSDYDKAAAYYEAVKNNNGIDPDKQALAEITKKNAELQLEEAQRILDGATLTSPIDGTVLTVASAVGEILDKDTYKSPYIEIADLTQPVLKTKFDETDLASINKDCSVKVTFTSMSKKTFEGSISQIDPSLTNTNNVMTIAAYINVKVDSSSEITNFPVGMNATVEMNCAIAKNALIVPLQALKNESGGKAEVYVLNSDGTQVAHTVEIGAETMSSAEVIGDIKVGDQVITSTIK